MDDLLTAGQVVRNDSDTLIAISSTVTHTKPTVDFSHDLSTNQIIEVLKSKPSIDDLSTILAAIDPYKASQKLGFDMRVPSTAATKILQILVINTIPDHWEFLNTEKKNAKFAKIRGSLLRSLSSIAGVTAILNQIRSLISAARAPDYSQVVRDLVSTLATVLEPKDFLWRAFSELEPISASAQRQVAWNQIISLIASSRILSVSAEALNFTKDTEVKYSWLGDGASYSSWLGASIFHLISRLQDDKSEWALVASLTERALSLGYPVVLLRGIWLPLLQNKSNFEQFGLLLDNFRNTKLVALRRILWDMDNRYLATSLDNKSITSEAVSGVAAFLAAIVGDRSLLKRNILQSLAEKEPLQNTSLPLNRAILAACDEDHDTLKEFLLELLTQFGDKPNIERRQQNEQTLMAQFILLVAGRLNRLQASQMKDIGRSKAYLDAVSNRIAASSDRARFLGMIIGTGISELIEEPGKSLKFDLEAMQGVEAQEFLALTKVYDKVGSIESIRALEDARGVKPQLSGAPQIKSSGPKPAKPSLVSEITDEVAEEEEEEDHQFIPYEKPDDDSEDDDEDPTLVQRTKRTTAPVYIRDLITSLRDNENVDRYHLAITTAPSLIRRKTGFGTELAENRQELALAIVSLNNDNNHPQFHESRLQSLIALIVSQPLEMPDWFSALLFDGDISQVQRSAIITALGLSAREIAGNGEDDAKTLGLPALKDTKFPFQKLSPALHAMYDESKESPISTLTKAMSRATLQPMVADVADAASGPNALKVRTFSSRLEVEKLRKHRDDERRKRTAKDVHKVLAEGYFYPLIGRFTSSMRQYSSSSISSYNPFAVPHILTLFLQTISLILNTAGPYTTYLPSLTNESLSLALSLYTSPICSDITIISGILTLFLTILDLNIASGSNGEERLVTENAAQVLELREWASQIFENMPSGKPGTLEDPVEQVRTLSAGVMIRLGEVTERYQGRLMGVNSGFQY